MRNAPEITGPPWLWEMAISDRSAVTGPRTLQIFARWVGLTRVFAELRVFQQITR
jgi:hypothetical protein